MSKIEIKQHDFSDCGAACLASISEHYNLSLPISRIRQYANTTQKGTTLLGLREAAVKLGFLAKGVKVDFEGLKDLPIPALLHVVIKHEGHEFPHYVVAYKITSKYIQIMDPSNGKLEKKPLAEFEGMFTGYALILVPDDDIFKEKNEKISNFKRILFLLKPHKYILLQAIIGAVLYTLLGFSVSIYVGKITDFVLVSGNKSLLNLMSVIVIGCLLLQIVYSVLKDVFILKTSQQIDSRLILGYYKHLFTMPQKFFDTMRIGEIMSRIGDAVKIRALINETALSISVNVLIVFFSFIFMFSFYWKLALIISLIIPFYVIIYLITNKLNKTAERSIMEKNAMLESQLVESIKNIGTVKRLSLEDFSKTRTELKFVDLLKSIYKSGMNGIFSRTATDFISRLFTIILLWVGTYYAIDGDITPGELFSFYSIIGYFTGPASQLIGTNQAIQNAMIASDRLFGIMDLDREEMESKVNLTRNNFDDIKFKNIDFSYELGRYIFKDLNITIKKGAFTAFVGESGSGKSTIASLIQNIYSPKEGKILIGEYDLNYISKDSINALITTVPQNVELFDGTIAFNISIGESNPDMEKIIEVSKKVGAYDFIESLPNGFNTYLGEFGANLSGGEKQRIAFARALYKDPEVLILDEATSALDSESEMVIKKLIDELHAQGKTIIVIAHKLQSIKNADVIYAFKKGEIVESGSHQELMNKEEYYYRMWNNIIV
ncbi:peptidase domain-containing ABC transporter [Flavobacterium endoglycinae]|uniref:Peptidase domain-containing ABC transporter n=1 Tax=Flavobacterium endoglycinae TaxID=2816357 RepID=A0ABX7QKK5_9FLAO|nr:peptidase domain-containing ABC transporter [Flavobacterium endoglycinae]QSW91081.1 peptidase domain-containing ABC transporter [Flavobacterium endoglycinae]